MELSIQRTLDGALFVDCGDDHRGIALWLEHELAFAPNYLNELLDQLAHLRAPASLSLRRHGFFIEIDNEQVVLSTAPDEGEAYEQLAEEQLAQVGWDCDCGFEDFIDLLESIQRFIN